MVSHSLSSRERCDARSLVLISNLGLAFIAHYNAPAFYAAMKGPAVATAAPRAAQRDGLSDLGRFGVAVSLAFGPGCMSTGLRAAEDVCADDGSYPLFTPLTAS